MQWEELKEYLLNDKKMSDKPGNIYTLYSRFRILEKYFSDKEFNRKNFTEFISGLRERKYSASYINNFIKMAKLIGKFAGSKEFADYTYFKERRANFEVLTPDEVEAIVAVDMKYSRFSEEINFRNKAIILLLYSRGLRIMEALDLRWNDIYETPWGMSAILRDTKNHDDAEIIIPERVAKMIRQLPQKSDLVFDLRDRCTINNDIKNRARKAGITKRVWNHLLRHSFAIHMLVDKGVDGYIVSELLRHKDPTSTQRYNRIDLKNQCQVLQMHDSVAVEQTLPSVTTSLRKYVDKFVNKQRFVRVFEENPDELVIRIQKAYK